jgi:hypothetical protein
MIHSLVRSMDFNLFVLIKHLRQPKGLFVPRIGNTQTCTSEWGLLESIHRCSRQIQDSRGIPFLPSTSRFFGPSNRIESNGVEQREYRINSRGMNRWNRNRQLL